MNRKKLRAAGLMAFVLLSLNFQLALAHETITVGDYEIEVGWLNEPPIVGEKNGIVLNVTDTSGGGEVSAQDIASLTVTLSYGGQRKILTFQPLGEDTPGQFMAPILPTVPGEYEIIFGGILGDTAVEAETHVEEVQPIDTLAFPAVDSARPTGAGTEWLIWLSILIGLIGVGIGVTALRKVSMR
jgi:hypothetical protein